MFLLFLMSFPWAMLTYLVPRPWTIAVPFIFWLIVARLGDAGILSDKTSLTSALLAGGLGAIFSLGGFAMAHRAAAAAR